MQKWKAAFSHKRKLFFKQGVSVKEMVRIPRNAFGRNERRFDVTPWRKQPKTAVIAGNSLSKQPKTAVRAGNSLSKQPGIAVWAVNNLSKQPGISI